MDNIHVNINTLNIKISMIVGTFLHAEEQCNGQNLLNVKGKLYFFHNMDLISYNIWFIIAEIWICSDTAPQQPSRIKGKHHVVNQMIKYISFQ